jgi:2-polyprenyl-3-methyl-5-hydroxy-6-metoxy-1,4-benzoquinol methylase
MSNNRIITETVDCDLCGSGNSEQLFVGRDMLHETEGQWPVVKCKDCGLIYTNPRPASQSIHLVYPSDYQPHHAKTTKKNSHFNRTQLRALREHWNYPPGKSSIVAQWLSWPILLAMKIKSRNYVLFAWQGSGKLLDYGCGGGGFMARMADLGWQVSGMDISPEAVENCKKQGFDACVGANPQEQFAPETFDVVTLWHVLEHVPSSTQTLKQVNSVLKPKGKVVLGLPNVDSYLARWFGPYWFAYELPRHVTHFNKITITKLLERTGFKVEKIFAQRHGQLTQRSMKYLARDKPKSIYSLLARSKSICSAIEKASLLLGQPHRMVVHAKKTSI